MYYQLPIYGLKRISGGDTLVFDETNLQVLDNGVVTREYTWDNFKYAQHKHIHTVNVINVYFLYFDDGSKVMVSAKDDSEDLKKLIEFEPNNKIRNSIYAPLIIGIALLVLFIVLFRLGIIR